MCLLEVILARDRKTNEVSVKVLKEAEDVFCPLSTHLNQVDSITDLQEEQELDSFMQV